MSETLGYRLLRPGARAPVRTRPGDAREVARGFARAWFTVLERADHLFHLQRFDATIELLLRFATGRIGEPPQGWAAPTWAGAAPARG